MGRLFRPLGNTAVAAATTSSGSTRVALTNTGTRDQVMIYATAECFIAFGTSSVTVAIPTAGSPANGIVVPAGNPIGLTLLPDQTHFAAITASGTATVYVVPGEGI